MQVEMSQKKILLRCGSVAGVCVPDSLFADSSAARVDITAQQIGG